ncbi:hypothetical protein N9Y17_01210 [Gammaproteobacteria bacterium]|nr:hypothetical protein [Gammaproteobacteria bacterium]
MKATNSPIGQDEKLLKEIKIININLARAIIDEGSNHLLDFKNLGTGNDHVYVFGALGMQAISDGQLATQLASVNENLSSAALPCRLLIPNQFQVDGQWYLLCIDIEKDQSVTAQQIHVRGDKAILSPSIKQIINDAFESKSVQHVEQSISTLPMVHHVDEAFSPLDLSKDRVCEIAKLLALPKYYQSSIKDVLLEREQELSKHRHSEKIPEGRASLLSESNFSTRSSFGSEGELSYDVMPEYYKSQLSELDEHLRRLEKLVDQKTALEDHLSEKHGVNDQNIDETLSAVTRMQEQIIDLQMMIDQLKDQESLRSESIANGLPDKSNKVTSPRASIASIDSLSTAITDTESEGFSSDGQLDSLSDEGLFPPNIPDDEIGKMQASLSSALNSMIDEVHDMPASGMSSNEAITTSQTPQGNASLASTSPLSHSSGDLSSVPDTPQDTYASRVSPLTLPKKHNPPGGDNQVNADREQVISFREGQLAGALCEAQAQAEDSDYLDTSRVNNEAGMELERLPQSSHAEHETSSPRQSYVPQFGRFHPAIQEMAGDLAVYFNDDESPSADQPNYASTDLQEAEQAWVQAVKNHGFANEQTARYVGRQVQYSQPEQMNGDQFKQSILLSIAPLTSADSLPLTANCQNWEVLICFAKTMGDVNRENPEVNHHQELTLNIDQMRASPTWYQAEQGFLNSNFGQGKDFAQTLLNLARGRQVNQFQPHQDSPVALLGVSSLATSSNLLDQSSNIDQPAEDFDLSQYRDCFSTLSEQAMAHLFDDPYEDCSSLHLGFR